MSKYILDTDHYPFVTDGIMAIGFYNGVSKPTTFYESLENLEELNSDYINEHFSDFQDTAYKKGLHDGESKCGYCNEYQRGFEDGKAVNDKGCEGCKYQANRELTCPCSECANNFKNQWTAKDDKIEVGDEVEWDGDKYIVTYLNKGINTGEIQDYDVMGADGSVMGYVSKCAITKTGRHFDIASILEEMRHD